MKAFDVAIIGAGPAGSSTAIFLARRGYAVTLLDKRRFPREKLCGDFVNPVNWPLLRKLGVADRILSLDHEIITTFRLTTFGGAETEVALPGNDAAGGCGVGLRRSILDQVLLAQAAAESVDVRQETRPTTIRKAAEGWALEVDGQRGQTGLRAKVIIGADGRNSWVAERLGMARSQALRRPSIGFQLRLSGVNLQPGKVGIHLFPGGYAGLVGVGGGEVNLCLAVDRTRFRKWGSVEKLLECCLSFNRDLKVVLERGVLKEPARSAYPVYFPARSAYGERVLLVGDAGRVSEPVTGEGIYFALKSGDIAAEAINRAFRCGDFSAERLSLYERDCRSVFRLRWRMNALIRWLIHRPALLAPLIRVANKKSPMLESLVRTICQPELAGSHSLK